MAWEAEVGKPHLVVVEGMWATLAHEFLGVFRFPDGAPGLLLGSRE